jgi:hypothetical protein
MALGAALAVSAGAGTASAQDFNLNKTTYLTFSGPVELPNMTLPAGAYMFRLNDNPGNRHIVEVRSRDGQKSFGYAMAIAATRAEPAETTIITFREVPAGQPAPIRYWFYPGNVIGHEFVYPRRQAIRIAKATNQNVLSTDESGDVKTMESADVRSMSPAGDETPVPSESAAAEQTVAQDRTAASMRQQQESTVGTSGRALPRTASTQPLVGLIGLLSLVGFASLRSLAFAKARARS